MAPGKRDMKYLAQGGEILVGGQVPENSPPHWGGSVLAGKRVFCFGGGEGAP